MTASPSDSTSSDGNFLDNASPDNASPDSASPDSIPPDSASPDSFKISPLIQLTLTALYIALVIPLPFLAEATQAPVPASWLWVGFALGGLVLYAGLSEKVIVDAENISVIYPVWVQRLGRKGWSLAWADITALKPRSTGQGGIVYYFLNKKQDRAFLLPMRVVGLARLLRYIQAKTNLDMRDVKPLSQPWMYIILLGLTALLLLVDIWVIAIAGSTSPGSFS